MHTNNAHWTQFTIAFLKKSHDRLFAYIKFMIRPLIVHKLYSTYASNTPSRRILSCTFTPKFTFTRTFFLVRWDLRTHLAMIKYTNEYDKLPYFLMHRSVCRRNFWLYLFCMLCFFNRSLTKLTNKYQHRVSIIKQDYDVTI